MITTPNYDLDIDTTLGGNNASDYIVPSQKAIKAYVDNSTGGNVDDELSTTSENPVQNKVITTELNKKINTSDIASSVSASSTNTVPVGAKLFYDTVGNIESALNTINSGSNS